MAPNDSWRTPDRPQPPTRSGRGPCYRGRCLWSCLPAQQIPIVRVLVDICFHERALGNHRQSGAPHMIERALDQGRSDALATEFGRHFSMLERDDIAGDFVIGRGDMAIDREFVTLFCRVVDDFAHATVLSSCWLASRNDVQNSSNSYRKPL